MNFLAHAARLLQASPVDPYQVAGVAVPDWLNVSARKTKCRHRHVLPWIDDSDPVVSGLARGIARHHEDDAAFHESGVFNELSLEFSKSIRLRYPDDLSMRVWFLGHILVELLIDAELTTQNPKLLADYYDALRTVDPVRVEQLVEQFCGRSPGKLAELIPKFIDSEFLVDYVHDDGLCLRVGQVLKRVGLNTLPDDFPELLPAMRRSVSEDLPELLAVR